MNVPHPRKFMSKTYFVKRKFCPGCKSKKATTIYSCGFSVPPIKDYLEAFYSSQGRIEFEYLKAGKYILDECNHCGLIYQKEIPNDFLMRKLYEEWIDPKKAFDHRAQVMKTDSYSKYVQEIMVLIAYFNSVPSQLKFLDFGMGWGNWCLMAKAFGCDSYGTELSKARIEYAKSQAIKIITWDEIPDYSFNFINTEQVFEHIPEPLETLWHLKESLKPNGLIKISVPNARDIKRRLRTSDWTAAKKSRNSLNPVSPLEHINCFNYASLTRMADTAGLEPVRIPLSIQYAYTTNWSSIKAVVKNILRPLYINICKRGTYVFFRQKEVKKRVTS